MDSKQQIIDQENQQTAHLIAVVDHALTAWTTAGDAWEATHSESAAADQEKAVAAYNEATSKLAAHVMALWRAGYRWSASD